MKDSTRELIMLFLDGRRSAIESDGNISIAALRNEWAESHVFTRRIWGSTAYRTHLLRATGQNRS